MNLIDFQKLTNIVNISVLLGVCWCFFLLPLFPFSSSVFLSSLVLCFYFYFYFYFLKFCPKKTYWGRRFGTPQEPLQGKTTEDRDTSTLWRAIKDTTLTGCFEDINEKKVIKQTSRVIYNIGFFNLMVISMTVEFKMHRFSRCQSLRLKIS